MWAAQCSNLQQQCTGQADGNAGAATQAGADGDGGAECVDAWRRLLGPEGKKEVQEGSRRGLVDFANLFGCFWGYGFDVRLDGGEEISIK